jgi:hypothetical protein
VEGGGSVTGDDELSEAIAKAFSVPAHLLSVDAPSTYQQILQTEHFAALHIGSEILAKWDEAVTLHRIYWLAAEAHIPLSDPNAMEIIRKRDHEASCVVLALGIGCPDSVAMGGPK